MSIGDPPESGGERWLIWTLAAAVVAFVCGVIGLYLYQPEPAIDLIYHSLQLFVLGSDPVTQDGTDNAWLYIAMFLAPATTLYGVLRLGRSILRDRLHRRAIARTVGHAVVTGDTPASIALASHLAAAGSKVVLIGNDSNQVARRQAIPVVRGDARELTTLRAAGLRGASVLFACATQTATNAAVVLAAGEISGRTARLDALAQVSSDELVEALRVRQVATATQGRRVAIDFFSLEDIAARQLIDRFQPFPASIEIVGFDAFGWALLRALLRHPECVTQPQSIVVTADSDSRAVEGDLSVGPAAGRKIEFRSRPDDPAEHADWVFVCLADEDDALRTALRLTRVVSGRVVLCLHRESPFRQALIETPGLDIFGILDASCSRELITGDAIIGRAARAIHARYIKSAEARHESVVTNPSMKPWAELPSHLQESNYAQAEHIGVKLAAISCRLVSNRTDLPRFEFRPGEIEQLARLEHVRWMSERRAAGFVHGPSRSGKQHPDLVDWPELSPESRSKDVDAVKHLPDLLLDAGLLIQRRE